MNNFFSKKKNSEPWNIDFQKRINHILKKGKKKVIYIYEKADTSTFRYRVYNMCQALSYSDKWAGTYFFEDELKYLDHYFEKIDVVVFVRTRWSEKMEVALNKIKKNNIPILFDADDLVFDVEKIPLLTNTLNVNMKEKGAYSYWFSYVSRIWLMGKKCDGYITTNNYIARQFKRIYGKKVFIINNFLNNEQIEISEKISENKKYQAKRNRFEIGYFSGTPSHINDFKVVAPEIKSLLEKHQNINLKVVGFMDFPEYLKVYVQNKRIIHRPLVNFLDLQKEISLSDINIIPLVDNEFTNCKSELKFFEAAIVNTISCTTPTYVFKENIEHGNNGFLCEQGEWFGIIEKVYKKDLELSTVTKHAKEYCIVKYSPQNQMENIENIFEETLNIS